MAQCWMTGASWLRERQQQRRSSTGRAMRVRRPWRVPWRGRLSAGMQQQMLQQKLQPQHLCRSKALSCFVSVRQRQR